MLGIESVRVFEVFESVREWPARRKRRSRKCNICVNKGPLSERKSYRAVLAESLKRPKIILLIHALSGASEIAGESGHFGLLNFEFQGLKEAGML